MVLEDANAYSYDAIMFRADSMNVPKEGAEYFNCLLSIHQ